jgi:O-antigen ligase/Flp pilus assembly protein TadD
VASGKSSGAAKPKSKAATAAAANKNKKNGVKAGAVAAMGRATDGMTELQKIAWWALVGLVFLVPLAMTNANWIPHLVPTATAFNLPLTYDQFDIAKVFVMRALALIGLAAWAFEFFFRGGTLRRSKLDWLILGFLAWVLLTSFLSISPATAFFGKYRRFEGFFSFVTYAVVFFLVTQLVDRPSRVRALARTLVVTGFIVSFYGVLQYVGLDPINWGANLPFEANRAFATYGNPDLLGGFIIFPLAISLALALYEKDLKWRAFHWVAFLTTVACWIVAFTRGAWIGGAVAIVIVIVAAFLARVKLHSLDWSFLGATGVAAVALIARSLTSSNSVMNVAERLKSIAAVGEGSALTRFEIWQAAWSAIKTRPIFGFGADTFRLVFPKFKPLAYVKDAGYLSVADNVHDYPLQLAAGIGIIGFLLLYGLFGWALWLGAPNAFSRGKGTERLVFTGFWAAAAGYITQLFFGLSVTGSTVFLWLALAVVVAPLAVTVEVTRKSWGPAVAVATLGLCTALWGYNAVWIVADNFFLNGQFQQTGDQIGLLKTAIALDPYNDMYRSQLGQTYAQQMISWISQAQQERQAGKDPGQSLASARASMLAAESTYKQTIAFVPTEYDNYVFLSSLYNQAGVYIDPAYLDKALATADQGIAVEPFGPAIRLQKALALDTLGRTADAVAVLKVAASMDPNYVDAHQFYAQDLAKIGQKAAAIVEYKLVLGLKPADPTVLAALQTLEGTGSVQTTPTK